ncbi:MAG: TonB-dependent receptor [Methylococcales bacterium]|nr:TonB-dependent receptor [Methylococcales bacterium]
MKNAPLFIIMLIVAPIIHSAENTHQLDTVTVTGTKTGITNLQTTPISITSFDNVDLFERSIGSVKELTHATPGLSIAENQNFTQVYIRGVGTNNIFTGSDTSSTVHYDGVYMSRPTMVMNDFNDIERIEVLKGPQGTLYGRNSVGGTINIIPTLPTEEFRAKASLDLGNFQARRLTGSVSGSLNNDDTMMGGVSFLLNDSDGYVKDLSTTATSTLANEGRKGARGTIRWRFMKNAEFILSTDYLDLNESPPINKPIYRLSDGSAPTSNPLFISDPHSVSLSFTPEIALTNYGTHAKFIWDISDQYKLTSISARRGMDYKIRVDADFTELALADNIFDEDQTQFSQEIRLNKQGGAMTWLLGAYYFEEKDDLIFITNSFKAVDVQTETTSSALFFQGRYAVNDKLATIAGIRYTDEDKTIKGENFFASGVIKSNQTSDTNLTPKIGFEYLQSNNLFLYGTISRGIKSGGFNIVDAIANDSSVFDPEILTAYEIGTKADWWNKRLRTNGSLFYYDYEDLQVQTFDSNGFILINNAASAEITGLELEMSFLPTVNWQFDAGISYLDAVYKKFFAAEDVNGDRSVLETVNAAGNHLNSAPELSIDLTAKYYQNFDNSTLTYRLNYYWQDREFYTPANQETKSQAAYALVNASLGYQTLNEALEVILYVNNLTDKDYFNATFDFFDQTGIVGRINPPRTYGVKALYQFD